MILLDFCLACFYERNLFFFFFSFLRRFQVLAYTISGVIHDKGIILYLQSFQPATQYPHRTQQAWVRLESELAKTNRTCTAVQNPLWSGTYPLFKSQTLQFRLPASLKGKFFEREQ